MTLARGDSDRICMKYQPRGEPLGLSGGESAQRRHIFRSANCDDPGFDRYQEIRIENSRRQSQSTRCARDKSRAPSEWAKYGQLSVYYTSHNECRRLSRSSNQIH